MKYVELYTDGGCRGNGTTENALGAYAGILIYPATGAKKEYACACPDTTNNRMEITAVIEGLKYLKESCEVTIYSDSAYVVNAYRQHWVDSWKKNNWHRGKSGELKNRELWMELDALVSRHRVSFSKVKGHSDNEMNNRADALVNQAMDQYKKTDKT